MTTRFTKLIASVLLLLAAVPYCYLLMQQTEQRRIRHEMKESLKEQMLQMVSISDDEVNWIEEGKEVWINDRMFDIKSLKHKDHQYTFKGLFDDEETGFVRQLEKEQQKENYSGYKLLAQLFQVFRSHFKEELPGLRSFEIIDLKFPASSSKLSQGQTKEISPPPKC